MVSGVETASSPFDKLRMRATKMARQSSAAVEEYLGLSVVLILSLSKGEDDHAGGAA